MGQRNSPDAEDYPVALESKEGIFPNCPRKAIYPGFDLLDTLTSGWSDNTHEIKSKLRVEKEVSVWPISVATFGGLVTLTGAVENATRKSNARQTLISVVGVKRVNNLLELKKTTTSMRP